MPGRNGTDKKVAARGAAVAKQETSLTGVCRFLTIIRYIWWYARQVNSCRSFPPLQLPGAGIRYGTTKMQYRALFYPKRFVGQPGDVSHERQRGFYVDGYMDRYQQV